MERSTRGTNEEWWRRWIWLFPATYLVHIAEEYLASGGFPAWASALTGLDFTPSSFLIINGVALGAMLVASGVAFRRSSFSWLVVTFGVIVAVNGALHVAASLLTRSYSPGAFSGALVWIPLGGLALHRARGWLSSKTFFAAIVVGLLSHGLVAAVAVKVSPHRQGEATRSTGRVNPTVRSVTAPARASAATAGPANHAWRWLDPQE